MLNGFGNEGSALAALSLAALALVAKPAHAEDRPVSVGPYAEIAIGGQKMVGKTKRRTNEGPIFALRAGTDLFSWLSVGGRLEISSHEVVLPTPPEGEYTQFYGGAGEARLSVPIGRIVTYAQGSIGYSMVSTNLLERVDILDPGENFTPTVGAGGGLEYQLQNRHYAFGLGGQWNMYMRFVRMNTVNVSAHLRYTY